MTYASTFTGIRGLDLAWESVMRARCSYSVERSAFCREVIWNHAGRDHRIVADIRDVDGSLPRTDAIIGGFPCQDVSLAGKGAGLEHGERTGLWGELARIVGVQRPDLVFLENVRGLLGRGLDHVLADLASLGFDAEWTCLRASDVGAPHRRERIFVLAYTHGRGLRILAERLEQLEAERGNTELVDESKDTRVVDAARERHAREALADPDDDGRGGKRAGDDEDRGDARRGVADGCDAVGRASHRWPPGPDDAEAWARWAGARPALRRSPHGLPGWIHSARVADGLRRARLRALGNAVVRQQAEVAIEQLIRRAVRG